MRRNRRVKIAARLAPRLPLPRWSSASSRRRVDVFRINMSHSTVDGAKTLYNTVRACGARHRHAIGILVDLQGPKFASANSGTGRVHLAEKSTFVFDREEIPGNNGRVFCRTIRFLKPVSTSATTSCSTTASFACA